MNFTLVNGVLNVITFADYMAIPAAFLVLRNLREPDLPVRVLWSRFLFVLLCGFHHAVMATMLFSGAPLWGLRTAVNLSMAVVSCWAVFEHLAWARIRKAPVSQEAYQQVREKLSMTRGELEQRMEELERSNRDLEQFAYLASHDLQEPLRMVASYVQMLERDHGDRLDEEAHDFIRHAADGARRMQLQVRALLDFSRVRPIGEGKNVEEVELGTVLSGVVDSLALKLEDVGGVVTSDRLPRVRANAAELAHVLQNLIGNALKFRSDRPPRVHLSAVTGGDTCEVLVRDNGIGFDPERSEEIFDLFKRLHTRAEYPGTGIGLALARRIIESHGGRIRATSRPGAGAEFRFTLPVAFAFASAAPADATSDERPSTARPAAASVRTPSPVGVSR